MVSRGKQLNSADWGYIQKLLASGITQAQVCRSFGIGKKTLGRYIHGLTIPYDEYDKMKEEAEEQARASKDDGKCFADEGLECRALIEKNCEGCSFFKTEKQNRRAQQAAVEANKKRIKGSDPFLAKKEKKPSTSLFAKPWIE